MSGAIISSPFLLFPGFKATFSNFNSDADYYPACYSGTFAVVSTTDNDEKAFYSNYGDWVDISAPGGETAINQTAGILSTGLNTYKWYHGTSMACPHISGVAALIVSYAYKNNVILNNSDIADILENTADDHYAQNPDYIGKLGTGRLNAYQALLETQSFIDTVVNPNIITTTSVNIYPNPSGGSFNIIFNSSVEDASYRIRDIAGKVVDEDKLTGTKNIINLNLIAKGMYFIELNLGSQSVVSKIIIE